MEKTQEEIRQRMNNMVRHKCRKLIINTLDIEEREMFNNKAYSSFGRAVVTDEKTSPKYSKKENLI